MKKLLLLFIPLLVAFSCGRDDNEYANTPVNNQDPIMLDKFSIVGKYRVYATSNAYSPSDTFVVSSGCLLNWTFDFKSDKTFVENKPTYNPCKDKFLTGKYFQYVGSWSMSMKYDNSGPYNFGDNYQIAYSTNKPTYDLMVTVSEYSSLPYRIRYFLKKIN